MDWMKKAMIVNKVGGWRLKVIGSISSISFIILLLTSLSWVWIDWHYQWRIMATAFIAFVVSAGIENVLRDSLLKNLNDIVGDNKEKLSNFEQKLAEMRERKKK